MTEDWLVQLRAFDWSSVEHAHGPATDVPQLLETVIQSITGAGPDALEKLFTTIHWQGSIFPATLPAVPFLIRAAKDAQSGGSVRAETLNLLGMIASSASRGMDKGSTLGRDVFAAVWAGGDLFASLLTEDADRQVRTDAAHVLGMLAARGPGSAPESYYRHVGVLVRRASEEVDRFALASIAFALGAIIPHEAAAKRVLRQLLARKGDDLPERIAAALGLGIEDPTAVNLLVSTLRRTPESDAIFEITGRRMPWQLVGLRFRITRMLCEGSADWEDRKALVLPGILAAVATAGGYTADLILDPVFRWLWPGGGIVMPLTMLSRTVLVACYDNPRIWDPPNDDMSLFLKRYGLPETRKEFGRLVGKA